MNKPLTDTQQAAQAIADFCTAEGLPDADKALAMAAGLMAARGRGQRGNQAFAGHVQNLAATMIHQSGAVDDATPPKSH